MMTVAVLTDGGDLLVATAVGGNNNYNVSDNAACGGPQLVSVLPHPSAGGDD
jgi:hypothetical protein